MAIAVSIAASLNSRFEPYPAMTDIVTPDIIASIGMYPADAGGRSAGIPAVQFRWSLFINGALFDWRLLLDHAGVSLSTA